MVVSKTAFPALLNRFLRSEPKLRMSKNPFVEGLIWEIL